MPKVSVIVPVYNTEKYIKKCLNSILEQKDVDYEIIVVNDGSTDNSAEVIKEYAEKYTDKIKYFEKQNGGLSDARNFGISKATGDYLCFVDSDDYIDSQLFEKAKPFIEQNLELIKYKCIRVNENHEEIEKVNGPIFGNTTGVEAFNRLFTEDVLIEPAWLYFYKREYFVKNNFEFPVHKYHEDWAIVPFILINAKSVASIDVYGYYYVQSTNSITRNNDDEKTKARAYDMLEHYDNLISRLSNTRLGKVIKENFKIYLSNCLILNLKVLPKKYHKQYIEELKKRKIADNIKARNFKQLIKKCVLKVSYELYLKIR
ncbi:MAG: glycosyltransferase [Clostridia bacterium]|nr:glycosyltransferase [Clostridia bacterium]